MGAAPAKPCTPCAQHPSPKSHPAVVCKPCPQAIPLQLRLSEGAGLFFTRPMGGPVASMASAPPGTTFQLTQVTPGGTAVLAQFTVVYDAIVGWSVVITWNDVTASMSSVLAPVITDMVITTLIAAPAPGASQTLTWLAAGGVTYTCTVLLTVDAAAGAAVLNMSIGASSLNM